MDELSNIDKFIIKQKLIPFLEEDLGFGDITSNIIPNNEIKAKIISKSGGILCGIIEVLIIFDMFNIKVEKTMEDGTEVVKGDQIILLSGKIRDILGVERLVLNILMRMSSIATSTNQMVKQIRKAGYETRIAATRKTIPGFRIFEKRAVIIGGGDPHRWRLDDMILLKDTHLDAILSEGKKISDFIKEVKRQTSFSKKIEIEVENEEFALEAAEAGVDIIMFDNMVPKKIEESIKNIREKCQKNQTSTPLFESSGNITIKNLLDHANTGVDIISTSEVIMNPSMKLDLSLKYIKENDSIKN